MTCSSSLIDESGNVFRIEGLYHFNCNEIRMFGYIDKFIIWQTDKSPKFVGAEIGTELQLPILRKNL
jgi:hypothetical protein